MGESPRVSTAPWPLGETIGELLRKQATRYADHPYFKCSGGWRTFADVDEVSERLAAGLAALGIGKGDRVGIISDNRDEFVETFFACAKLGAIQVPLNTYLKGDFLKYQLIDADLGAVVVDAAGFAAIAPILPETPIKHVISLDDVDETAIGVEVSHYGDVARCAEPAPMVEVDPSDVLGILYTSGTTGMPKGCMLPHGYYRYAPQQYLEDRRFVSHDRIMFSSQLFHTSGQVYMLMVGLAGPCQLIIKQTFSASRFVAEAKAEQVKHLFGVGAMGVAILATPEKPEDAEPGTIQSATWVPMTEDDQLEFERRFKVTTWGTGYGQTECMPIVHAMPTGPRNRRACGVPVPQLEVRIVDEHDQEVPRGQAGEIVVRPRFPDIMYQGYWRKPEATLAAMSNFWHHTGDYGRQDDEDYLYFVDRKQQSIRRRGENVSSHELEGAIRKHPSVANVAVHAVPSPLGEEDIKAVLVLREDHSVRPAALFEFFAENLPYFAVPRYVEIRVTLPVNAAGRVMKHLLKEEGITAATWDLEAMGLTVARDKRR